MIPPESLAELTKLRDRVAYLEAELDLARDAHNKKIERLIAGLGISVNQARTIMAMDRKVLTRQAAMGLDLHRVSDCEYRSLDSLIKHMRRRVPWLKVRTIYGLGYIIDDPESLKRIHAALGGHQ